METLVYFDAPHAVHVHDQILEVSGAYWISAAWRVFWSTYKMMSITRNLRIN